MNLDQLWDELASDLEREFRSYRSQLRNLDVTVKADSTLLTNADIAVENLIIDRIRKVDPNPVVVAEEDVRTAVRHEVLDDPARIWVIDPIDGTAEFVKPHGREFCSVVCLLEDLLPVAAFILAPELGSGSSPLLITCSVPDAAITVNGQIAHRHGPGDGERWASLTRSKDEPSRSFESGLAKIGYQLKTRTTSQTLDMVRTALDIAEFTDPPLPQFHLFARTDQKVWDGLAGLCLGRAAGLVSVDAAGNNRLPVNVDILSQPEPVFNSTIMGDGELVTWFLRQI
jgi:3'(2'), 5'-bisphosphate nucleotidase